MKNKSFLKIFLGLIFEILFEIVIFFWKFFRNRFFFLKFFRGQLGVKFWILTGFLGFSKVIIIRYLWSRFFESLQLFEKFNCQKPSVCPTSLEMAKKMKFYENIWKFMSFDEFSLGPAGFWPIWECLCICK